MPALEEIKKLERLAVAQAKAQHGAEKPLPGGGMEKQPERVAEKKPARGAPSEVPGKVAWAKAAAEPGAGKPLLVGVKDNQPECVAEKKPTRGAPPMESWIRWRAVVALWKGCRSVMSRVVAEKEGRSG